MRVCYRIVPSQPLVWIDVGFRGVTRHCEGDMTVEFIDADTATLAGASTFDIRDFGMQPPKILVFKVEPTVHVRVEILAERER